MDFSAATRPGFYTSMYDQQIAQQMTAGKGLGLAEEMVKQMQTQKEPSATAGQVPMKFDLQTVTSFHERCADSDGAQGTAENIWRQRCATLRKQ